MDISVTIKDFELKFSMWYPTILLEGSVSQNLNLGPSFSQRIYICFTSRNTSLNSLSMSCLLCILKLDSVHIHQKSQSAPNHVQRPLIYP